MENKERQILSEIMDLMASVRSQLELLDAKMAELQQVVGQEDMDMTPIDLDIDDILVEPVAAEVDVVVEEPVVVEQPEDDLPDDDLPDDDLPFDGIPEIMVSSEEPVEEPLAEPVEESVEEPVVETVEEEVVEEEVVEDDDDLPIFAEPEPVKPVAPIEQKPKQAVIDSMTDRQAWRTDMPGTQVKDIRSAISLNDRILFINMLFSQDPMLFQDALTRINQMGSLDEVVEYVMTERPEWDLESETVYRFMMAVRRKIR